MAGVALYMLAISGVIAFGVVGHHIPPVFLVVSLLTACGSFGIVRLLRWGWALSLAATFLLMLYQFYLLFRLHEAPRGILGRCELGALSLSGAARSNRAVEVGGEHQKLQ